jgi:hypothetical protein
VLGKIKRWAQHEADIYDPAMFKASTWQRVVESSLWSSWLVPNLMHPGM